MRVVRVIAMVALVVVTAAAIATVVVRNLGIDPRELESTAAGRVDSRNGDCGWTVPLGDGKVLWVVCDPTALPGGVANTVAVTSPDDRSPTFQEANFVPFAPTDLGRCSDHGGAATWVDGVSAAPGPTTGTTLVAAFFIHGCREFLLDRTDPGDRGVALYQYDHGSTGIRRAQVQAWDLFPGRWSSGAPTVAFGAGATYHDGHHYAYACHPDETPDWENEGQCSIARAPRLARLGDRGSWAFWQGPERGWVACAPDLEDSPRCSERSFRRALDDAAPLDLPLPRGETAGGFTPQQFSVSWSEQLGLFVSAAPRAFADPTLRVRVAPAPEGPWSAPGDVPLDCDPGAVDRGFNCYHLSPHPDLGDDASIPFFIHDAGHEGNDDLDVVDVPVCELASLAGRPCTDGAALPHR